MLRLVAVIFAATVSAARLSRDTESLQPARVHAREELFVPPTPLSPSVLSDFLASYNLPPVLDSDPMSTIVAKVASGLKAWSMGELAKRGYGEEDLNDMEYPYFGFMPRTKGKVTPNSPALHFSGWCYKDVTISVTSAAADASDLSISIVTANPVSLLCTETMILGTIQQYSVVEIALHGTKALKWSVANATAGELWDLVNNGVRVFSLPDSAKNLLNSVAKTVEMFEPCASRAVAEESAQKNLDFLAKYRGLKMTKRTITDVILNETLIHSGDFLGVIRLDGLDPMLAWAMGSQTGHTTVAVWGDDGVLYVCESTSTTSYWDTNGIQRTPYREWLTRAKAASFNVFHLPLSPEYRAKFNETAMWQWFKTVEGLDYGYNTMLWGWIDTPVNNYPCLPNDPSRCLSWDVCEVFFPLIGRLIAKFVTFYDQAFNHRLGTEGLDFGELLREAATQGIAASSIATIVEDDTWVYNMTRDGKDSYGQSMVCCVFVCHAWKAAGVFSDIDDEINCGELTNWDDYSMKIFDSNFVRPQECVDADPSNPVCQLLGEYTLFAEKTYNTKQPYKHIAERCPGLAPDYIRPDKC